MSEEVKSKEQILAETRQAMVEDLNRLVLKVTILREWRAAHIAGEIPDFQSISMLEIIDQYPGLTASELAKFFGVGQSSMSDKVEVLISSGMIERGEGKRNLPISITERGREKLTALRGRFNLNVIETALEKMDRDDLSIIQGFLDIISDPIDAQVKETIGEPLLFTP